MNLAQSKPGPVFVIAEAGVNHNGSLDMAVELVDASAAAGADAIKFQTFSAERLATTSAGLADYQKRNLGHSESQIDMLRRLELGPQEHRALMDRCRARGLAFMSSPFDMESLRFLLDELQLPMIKIPSGEITNGPFLLEIGRSGRRAILSTGMAELSDVASALDVLAWGYLGRPTPEGVNAVTGARDLPEARPLLDDRVTVLQCTTEYPAPLDSVHLRAMDTLRQEFGLPVGLSDHSEGIVVPIAAVARGAVMIEKHVTLDRTLVGPDHKASIEPDDLKDMVAGIRAVEQALGSAHKGASSAEMSTRAVARKSLVAVRPIRAGAVIGVDDLAAMRPGSGVSPMQFWEVVGTVATRDYQTGEQIAWSNGR